MIKTTEEIAPRPEPQDRYQAVIGRLSQANISPLDRAELCAELKDLYVRLHPETRQGAAGGTAKARRRQSDLAQGVVQPPSLAVVGPGSISAFSLEASKATGLSERSIMRDAQIGAALPPDVRDTLRAAPRPPSQNELLQLVKLPAEEQRKIVAHYRVRSGAGLAKAMRTSGGAHVEELDFQAHVMLALGARPDLRIWRQNVGAILVRDRAGRPVRSFHAGPPKGAADITGVIAPEGWRLELELKADGEKQSEAQRCWHLMVEQHGGIYLVVAYEDARPLKENVANAVGAVDRAIATRRRS
jgi:hypothetical protein